MLLFCLTFTAATEPEFRKIFYETEGISFIEVLKKYRMSSFQLFSMMPDVVKIIPRGNLIFLQRAGGKTGFDKIIRHSVESERL